MPGPATTAALAALVQRYPDVPESTVAMVLENACATVAKALGRDDLELASDLALLRLDVRGRRAA